MDKLSLPLLIGAASFNLIVIIAGTLAAWTVSSRQITCSPW